MSDLYKNALRNVILLLRLAKPEMLEQMRSYSMSMLLGEDFQIKRDLHDVYKAIETLEAHFEDFELGNLTKLDVDVQLNDTNNATIKYLLNLCVTDGILEIRSPKWYDEEDPLVLDIHRGKLNVQTYWSEPIELAPYDDNDVEQIAKYNKSDEDLDSVEGNEEDAD